MYFWVRLSLLLLCAANIWAQNDRIRYQSQPFNRKKSIENKFERALWRHSTWSASPIFGLSETGYDNNVFNQQDSLKRADYTIAPYLGLETIWRPNGRFAVENDIRVAYVWFQENEDLNGIEYTGDSKWHVMFRRAHLTFSYSIRDSFRQPNSEIDDRVDHRNESFTGDIVFQLNSRLFVDIEYRHNEFGFQGNDPVLNRLNQSGDRYLVTMLWQRSQRFWPLLELAYDERDFQEAFQPYTLTSESAAIGFRNEIGERFHVDLKSGPASISYDYPQNPELDSDESIIMVKGYGDFKITRRVSLDLSLSQSPVSSIYEGFNYYISSRVTLGTSYQFSKNVALGPTIEFGQNDYRSPIISSTPLRNDDILFVGLRSQIPLKKPYQMGLTIGWHRRESSVDSLSDKGLRVFMNLSYRR